MPPGKLPVRSPTAEEARALSRFVDPQSGREYFIEPLNGIARHPHSLRAVGCTDARLANECPPGPMPSIPSTDIFDIRYLVVENHCGPEGPQPRALLFDLGCTYFSDAKSEKDLDALKMDGSHGSGQGPSIPLFYRLFSERCVEFDEIYAWEAATYSPSDWWSRVPVQFRGKMHFYNIPVMELSVGDSARGRAGPHGSFLRMFALTATPADFVVLKIDIDGGPEMEIAYAIAARPELSALVDVLFFEYHFDEPGLNGYWGNTKVKGSTVDTALNLMRRYRELGIRAHFWI